MKKSHYKAACLMGGCAEEKPDCQFCGFDAAEAKRRKKLPLIPNGKGLSRKLVRAKARRTFTQVTSIDENGQETHYPSIKAAAAAVGVEPGAISNAILREYRCGGFRWRKENPPEQET